MGRSVSYPTGAIVAYREFTPDNPDYADYAEWEWQDLIDWVIAESKRVFPSMREKTAWLGHEDQQLCRNQHAAIGISEYCGLVAVWLVPINESPLASAWVLQVEDRFLSTFGTLKSAGRASNGEQYFTRIDS